MKKGEKKSAHKVIINTLSSIIFIILIISIINVGLSIFLEGPKYDDFCTSKAPIDKISTEAQCDAAGGKWEDWGAQSPRAPPLEEDAVNGYCDVHYECRQEWEEAQKSFNQLRYYVFAILGLALFFMGAYVAMPILQYTGLASGAILLTQGIVTNFENKTMVFVSLIIILGIFSFLVFKKLAKK